MDDGRPIRAMYCLAIVAAVGGGERVSGPLARVVRFRWGIRGGFSLASCRPQRFPNPVGEHYESDTDDGPRHGVARLGSQVQAPKDLVDLFADPARDSRF